MKPIVIFHLFTTLLLLIGQQCIAKTTTSEEISLAKLIDIAGQQRMLSQKIAKAYFFHGQHIRPEKTRQQLVSSLDDFNKNFSLLKSHIKLADVQDMLVFLEMAKDEMAELVTQPYSNEKATLVLDYSETLLEGSHNIVLQLEKASKKKKVAIVNTAGRQRMLAQRIAKYYIAYQAGFRDDNTIAQLQQAVVEFEKAQKILENYPKNTPQIKSKLIKVKNLWRVVSKFYKNARTGGLPVIVLSTTDNIMQTMNDVTSMYVATTKS